MINHPPLLGLFQKRIDGDNALLNLAKKKFQECGLGTEIYAGDIYAGDINEFNEILNFRPEPFKYSVAHLARNIDLLTTAGIERVVEFSSAYSHLVSGVVLHDQKAGSYRLVSYIDNIKKLCEKLGGKLPIFIEYASDLEIDAYLEILHSLMDTPGVGACIDVGHLGIHYIDRYYSEKHSGQNIFKLKKAELNILKKVISEVNEAVEQALPSVITLIKKLKPLNKHIHFHLHDGHPLSVISPYGLSDHLSFFEKIPIQLEYNGNFFLNPMFGEFGLSEIVGTSLEWIKRENLSFTLELHPSGRRRVIDKEAYLFQHWKDLTNAEIMNDWLWELSRNSCLVKEYFNEKSK
jgi:sugar phosphate isomerase/epimerase